MPQEQTDAGAAEQSTSESEPVSDRAALRDDEFSYRQLFDNMAEGFALHEIIADATGKVIDFRFLAANPAFDRHTGLQGRAIIGKTMLEVVPGADRHQIAAYGRVALTGEPLSFEYRSDTFGRDVRVRAYSPSPGRFVTIFEDITERKRMETALRQSEEKFAKAFALNPAGIAISRQADGCFLEANPAYLQTVGYSCDELIGRRSTELGIRGNARSGGAHTHTLAARLLPDELLADRLVGLGAPNLAFAGVWLKMQRAVKTCV